MSARARPLAGLSFEALDFLCMPSRDVERGPTFFREVIGVVVVFAIETFGARPPISTRHSPISRSAVWSWRFGIPHGPCAVRAPGRQRLGVYELTRPQVDEHLATRFDFGKN
jgi:hypothetical protein